MRLTHEAAESTFGDLFKGGPCQSTVLHSVTCYYTIRYILVQEAPPSSLPRSPVLRVGYTGSLQWQHIRASAPVVASLALFREYLIAICFQASYFVSTKKRDQGALHPQSSRVHPSPS
jgi:hypothetical protein